MIQKCSIENINNNMHYIGLIILIFIVIISILYFIKVSINSEYNNEIVEKYSNTDTFRAKYLNTDGKTPLKQKIESYNKEIRSPTLNLINTSTATFRPCQIHFNNEGTSKYLYEDGWQEFDTLKSQENPSEYKVPFKKFTENNNNVNDFNNFNETAICFKKKNTNMNENTYKYKDNKLINYKPDSYVAIQFTEDKKNDVNKDLFMQMFFNKLPEDDSTSNKYRVESLDSICSYNYNRNLSLGNVKLYRLTLKDNIINAIDYIIINNEDNSKYIVYDKEKQSYISRLLGTDYQYYYIDNGSIYNTIVKNKLHFIRQDGINVKIYKFNRNLDCTNQVDVIKSYQTSDARLKSDDLISATPYNSKINQVQIPDDIILTYDEINELIKNNALINGYINEMNTEIITKCLNVERKANNEYKKSELLEYIYNFSRKLIAILNKTNVIEIIRLGNYYNDMKEKKQIFLNTFNTIQKFIPLYEKSIDTNLGEKSTNTNSDESVINNLINDLGSHVGIEKHEITLHKYKNIKQIIRDEQPFTLENIYEIKIYTTDNTLILEKDTICDILVVGGGGAGGRNIINNNRGGGGGGAGGLIYMQKHLLVAGNYNIIVGKGGVRGSSSGNSGNDSRFGNIVATGGGGGGGASTNTTGSNGGSGGGGGDHGGRGGAGTTNQGFNGGNTNANRNDGGGGGGGGGAGTVGESYTYSSANIFGLGGNGRSIDITGKPITYAKGGNGGNWYGVSNTANGTADLGNGGDGARFADAGNGGSGIVIVKYLKYFQADPNTLTKRELVINTNLNNDLNNIPKIITKNADIIVTLNDNNIVTLQKNKSYYIQKLNNNAPALVEYSEIYDINENTYIYQLTDPNSQNKKHVVKFPNDILCNVVIVAGGGSGGENGGCEGGGGGGGGGVVYAEVLFKKDIEYIFEVGNGGVMDGYNDVGITIYSEPNFGGRSFVKGVGNYNMYGEPSMGLANDELSSVKVPSGYSVTLYYHGNFGGPTITLTADTPYLPSWFDNKTSGFVVTKTGRTTGTGVSGNNSLIYDREKRFLNIVAYGGGAGGMYNGLDGGSGGGGSGHGGHRPGGNVLNRNTNDAFGVINFVSYGNSGGMGYHAGKYGAGGGGGGAGKIGNSWASESKSFSSLGSNVHNGADGGDGISLSNIGEFKNLRNSANIILGGGGGGASGMDCHRDWSAVMGNSGGLGGTGGGGRGGNRNNPRPGVMGLGGGGGGSSHAVPARGGSGVIYIYRKREINTIFEIPTNQLKISYNVEDDTQLNKDNARKNNDFDNQEPSIIKPENEKYNNIYIYKIGTKTANTNQYLKCKITITSLIAYYEPKFATKSGNTYQTISNDKNIYYEFKYIKDIKPNDIILKEFEVLFYNNVSGDIYMMLDGYANIFRIKNLIDINTLPDMYNNKLLSFLSQPQYETTINNLFKLNEYDKNIQIYKNNSASISINSRGDGLMNCIGLFGKDEVSEKLEKLKNIYNALYSYNSEDIAINENYINNHTLNIGKKISDIITTFNTTYDTTFNINNIITYENPNLQSILDNYVYFQYPIS